MGRILLIALVALLTTAAQACGRETLVVSGAVLDPDRRAVGLTLTCPGGCAGTLRATTSDGDTFTAALRIRPTGGRPRRLLLPLRPDGLHRLAQTGPGFTAEARLLNATHERTGSFPLAVRPSCRTGSTVAASAGLRAFRLAGVGIYACERPSGRPLLLSSETRNVVYEVAGRIRVAGRFAAFARTSAFKCSSAAVFVVNVLARRTVRERGVSTRSDSSANSCTSTGDVGALVLRPSGAIAFSETAGDDGAAVIRAVDDGGDRLLARWPGVDPASLRATDDATIEWREDGVARTATPR